MARRARNTAAQGARFENDVIHYLSGCVCELSATPSHVGWSGFGYDCIRSAASKGAVDIVAVPPLTPLPGIGANLVEVLFIQCKVSNHQIPPAERLAVQNLALRAGALPIVAWRGKDPETGRSRPLFKLLTGPGPKDWVPWNPERTTT